MSLQVAIEKLSWFEFRNYELVLADSVVYYHYPLRSAASFEWTGPVYNIKLRNIEKVHKHWGLDGSGALLFILYNDNYEYLINIFHIINNQITVHCCSLGMEDHR